MNILLRISFLVYFFHSCIPIQAQPKPILIRDLLKATLKTNLNDTVRVQKLQALSQFYILKDGEYKVDIDSSYFYLEKAELLSKKINFQTGTLMSLILYSQIYREGGELKKAKAELNKAFYIAEKNKILWLKGEAYRELTNYYELDKVGGKIRLRLVEKALDAFRKGGTKKQLADILLYYAGHYHILGEYKKALEKANDAKLIYNAIGFTDLQYLYSQIFRTYLRLGMYQEAINYGMLSIKTGEINNDTFFLMNDFKSLGSAYYAIENYTLALKYHKNSFEYITNNNKVYLTLTIGNLIIKDLLMLGKKQEAKHFLDNIIKTQHLNKYSESVWMYICCIAVYDELKLFKLANLYCDKLILVQEQNKNSITESFNLEVNNAIITHLFKVKNFNLSLKFIQKNKNQDALTKDIYSINYNYLMAFKIDSALGNYLSAISNLQKYERIKDSLFTEVKSNQISNLEVQYQAEKKDKNIQNLKNENELQKINLTQSNRQKLTIALILVLSVIISGLLFREYLNKKESNRNLELNKHKIQEKNKTLEKLITEKEWLLKEIHHRVKNNLQIIMSLLNVQASFLKDKVAVIAIKDSQNRINSMSLIHQHLYQTEDLSYINMYKYIKELISHLKDCCDTNISFKVEVQNIIMDVSKAIPIGLILNEAITNAIKYAFPNNRKGEITVILKHTQADNFLLEIADNGIGLEGEIDISTYHSLGMKLMEGLSNDLNAKIKIINSNGLKVSITFTCNKIIYDLK